MATPTQMVVSKGIPNSLIAENLLKILRKAKPTIHTKTSLPFPFHGMVGPQTIFIFPAKLLQTEPDMLTLHLCR